MYPVHYRARCKCREWASCFRAAPGALRNGVVAIDRQEKCGRIGAETETKFVESGNPPTMAVYVASKSAAANRRRRGCENARIRNDVLRRAQTDNEMMRSRSASVAGLKTTICRSDRPTTARVEYSSASIPAAW